MRSINDAHDFGIAIIFILVAFLGLILGNRFIKPVDEEKLKALVLDVERKERLLNYHNALIKEWEQLIKERSLALKEPTMDNYYRIDKEINFIKQKIKNNLNSL